MTSETKSRDIQIRDMRPEDRPAIVRFMGALNNYEIPLSPDRAPGSEMAEGHVDFLLAEVQRRGGFTLVAVVDGQSAGFLLACVMADDDGSVYLLEPFRKVGEISDVYVDPAFRRLGLTRAMIAEAERRFRSMGLRRMEIRFLEANEPAERTYRDAGFAPHERIFIKPL